MKTAAAAAAALLAVPAASASVARPASPALVARVDVTASEFKFVLSAKTAKRGVVVFHVTNVGALAHDFMIEKRKTKLLKHGESANLRVVFLRKGHYQFMCTVTGHAAAGMKGVFTIT